MAGEEKKAKTTHDQAPEERAKAQALKEANYLATAAKNLLTKLEDGDISPYSSAQNMGNDIRSKMRQSYDRLHPLAEDETIKVRRNEKDKADDAKNLAENNALVERIRKAVGNIEIKSNPFSMSSETYEYELLVPYLSQPPKNAPVDTKSPKQLIDEKYTKKQGEGIEGAVREVLRWGSFGSAVYIDETDKLAGEALKKYCDSQFADKNYPTCKGIGDMKTLNNNRGK